MGKETFASFHRVCGYSSYNNLPHLIIPTLQWKAWILSEALISIANVTWRSSTLAQ